MYNLPNTEQGYLPLYVLVVGITAVTNAISCYTDTSYLRRIYNPPSQSQDVNRKTTSITRTTEIDYDTPPEGRRPSVTTIAIAVPPPSPVTELSARTFATWNFAVGLARMIAAYHLNEQSWYVMSILTNVVGLLHFGGEAFYWKTAKPSGPWLAPISVASIGLIWHLIQFSNYVR